MKPCMKGLANSRLWHTAAFIPGGGGGGGPGFPWLGIQALECRVAIVCSLDWTAHDGVCGGG